MTSAADLRRLTALHDERRRAPRDDVDYATVAWMARDRFDVRVLNISPMGFHARGGAAFERGGRLSLELPVVGVVAGQIAWALTGCCGGWFFETMSTDRYSAVLRAMIDEGSTA